MARPRSEVAHLKVLDAAVQLFAERGIEGTSIDAIASQSGVSKATIYKHWADKDALCLDALIRAHRAADSIPPLDPDRPVKEQLVIVLAHQPPRELQELQKRLQPHLMAYAARNLAFGNEWRKRVTEPPRRDVKTLLTRAVAEGQLRPDLRYDVAEALLLGPMVYRYIFSYLNTASQRDVAVSAVDALWSAYSR